MLLFKLGVKLNLADWNVGNGDSSYIGGGISGVFGGCGSDRDDNLWEK
jgi:hypothetical protein